MHATCGRVLEARRVWRRVADTAQDPLDRIRAFDELGLSWLSSGDLEAAAGVLDACRNTLASIAREVTVRGARVRRALTGMRVVRDLPRFIEARARQR